MTLLQPEKSSGTIKEQLAAIAPTLNQLNKQKEERVREFVDVQSQIEKICGEIAGTLEVGDEVGPPEVDEDDLSLEKLEDFRAQLQELQKEKVSCCFIGLVLPPFPHLFPSRISEYQNYC